MSTRSISVVLEVKTEVTSFKIKECLLAVAFKNGKIEIGDKNLKPNENENIETLF